MKTPLLQKKRDPLLSQLSQKDKENKKIHNAETYLRSLQSSINMIKITTPNRQDIAQSVDSRILVFWKRCRPQPKMAAFHDSLVHKHDGLDLSAKLHQMTEDNSSWFGNLLGEPWMWIKEIANLLLFLLLAHYLCVHSIKCFIQQMDHISHKKIISNQRKDYYP